MSIDKLNIRQMQAYAGMCLLVFCKKYGLNDNDIKELCWHLIGILSAESLTDWERDGAKLLVAGRGDPIPREIDKVIPKAYKSSLYNPIDNCVEVGMIDMFGASTNSPRGFLAKAIDILKYHDVGLPPTGNLMALDKSEDRWGKPIKREELSKLIEEFECDFFGVR